MQTAQQLFGIVGYPVGHSLSPALHNWGFQQAEVPGLYMAWGIQADGLADFFKAVRTLNIQGGSITVPHKVDAMRHMDKVTDQAKKMGAINAFFWKDGQLWGENTDVTGFMAPLLGKKFKSALIMGAGGAARAAIAGLQALGVPNIGITNRTEAKAEKLAKDFGVTFVPWAKRTDLGVDLLVNATTQGMKGDNVNNTPYPREAFKGKGLAYEIVYTPLMTRFRKEAGEAGWDTQDGLTMFVEQARAAFSLWTGGKDLPAQGARDLLAKAMGL